MSREGTSGWSAMPRIACRVSMRVQVWAGMGALLALLAGMTLVALTLLVSLTRHEEHFSDRSVPYARAVDDAALAAKGVANDERGFLISGDRGFVAEAERRARRAEDGFAAAALAASGAAQYRAVLDARTGFRAWVASVRREFATYTAADRQREIAQSFGPNRDIRKGYEIALARAASLGSGAIRTADQRLAHATSRSIVILVGCLIVALLLGGAIATWIARSIVNPISRLASILAAPENA